MDAAGLADDLRRVEDGELDERVVVRGGKRKVGVEADGAAQARRAGGVGVVLEKRSAGVVVDGVGARERLRVRVELRRSHGNQRTGKGRRRRREARVAMHAHEASQRWGAGLAF
jgi:hypothetical protein